MVARCAKKPQSELKYKLLFGCIHESNFILMIENLLRFMVFVDFVIALPRHKKS